MQHSGVVRPFLVSPKNLAHFREVSEGGLMKEQEAMNLDEYYQACEAAIQCQADGHTMGVTLHLSRAAQMRDDLVARYRSRLEFSSIRGVLDYWEGTLLSLPDAKRTGKAAIYIPEPSEHFAHLWEMPDRA